MKWQAYAFLWHMRPAAAKRTGYRGRCRSPRRSAWNAAGDVVCEFQALGFRLMEFVLKPELKGYFARFEALAKGQQPARLSRVSRPGKDRFAIGVAASFKGLKPIL